MMETLSIEHIPVQTLCLTVDKTPGIAIASIIQELTQTPVYMEEVEEIYSRHEGQELRPTNFVKLLMEEESLGGRNVKDYEILLNTTMPSQRNKNMLIHQARYALRVNNTGVIYGLKPPEDSRIKLNHLDIFQEPADHKGRLRMMAVKGIYFINEMFAGFLIQSLDENLGDKGVFKMPKDLFVEEAKLVISFKI